MCAQNKTKKGKKSFSYLFRTHLAIIISAMVLKFFFIKHELHANG